MRYSQIRKQDISNGDGIGVALFVQGCSFHCHNCFNQNTWDFEGGKEWTDNEKQLIFKLSEKEYITRLSILGGEPLHSTNIVEITDLIKEYKTSFPKNKIWVWTGFSFEDIKNLELMDYIDYLIDGRYKDELRDLTLKYRGSSNQNVYKRENDKWIKII